MEVDPRELFMSLGLGLGLAAACGLRIFLPFLALGLAARAGAVPLAGGFEWVASLPALLAFATATALEIAAYYVPWIDNLLDVAATPAAIAAGSVASASVLTDLPPLLQWSVALVGGGTTAGIVKGSTSLLRLGSTTTTGGLGNPLVATIEWVGSAVTSLLAILLPVLALVGIGIGLFVIYRLARRLAPARPGAPPSPNGPPPWTRCQAPSVKCGSRSRQSSVRFASSKART